MDSQPWRQQGARFDPDDDDGQYGPPASMSFRAFTERIPQSALDDITAAGPQRTTATATKGSKETDGSKETKEGAKTEDGEGSTYTSPLRIHSTTVQLSTPTNTSPFVTPTRAAEESQDAESQTRPTRSIPSTPSTLQTTTSSTSAGTLTTTPSNALASGVPHTGADSTALPDVSAAQKHGMSHGEVAAAVILPILAALALFAALFLCRRRRRKSRNGPPPPPFFPAMREKMGQFRHRPSSRSTISPPPAPILTFPANNAYYTGLDTSSRATSQEHEHDFYAPAADPPPPYAHEAKPPPLETPALVARARSPFEDPEPVSPLVDAAVLQRPPTSVSRAPSFSSTQYSDSASVHSARAARMSVGGTQMMVSSGRGSGGVDEGGGQRRSVFDDPAEAVSPVSEVGGFGDERER